MESVLKMMSSNDRVSVCFAAIMAIDRFPID